MSVYRGPFFEAQATRLLWRAGFGPRPGQAAALASLGLEGAVLSLTRPQDPVRLDGPAPHNSQRQPLDPVNVWGDNHVWWLDRMVRTNHPLIERMALIWHSWFATSVEGSSQKLMLDHYWMLRSHALGNFQSLFEDVTKDPAMLLWLSGAGSVVGSPNENYGREMMELFSLGADRGAYTQHDVREQARALTGWINDYSKATGDPINFRFDPASHDRGVKTIFGRRGRFDWRDSVRLCVEHPLHPSFMIRKLWGYFIGVAPPRRDQRMLERLYVRSGYETAPVVEAILQHPLLYEGPRMVTPPVVYHAGLMRASGTYITTEDWAWIGETSGQLLFWPPNVAGWDYTRWVDTATWRGRFYALDTILDPVSLGKTDHEAQAYPARETPAQALRKALAFWGDPPLSATTKRELLAYGRRVQRAITADWERSYYRCLRQNALRALIPVSPDMQTN